MLAGGWYFLTINNEPYVPEDTAPPLSDTNDPEESDTEWVSTTTMGTTWQYPENFGTTYIEPYDWPPQLTLSDEPFICTSAGSTTDRSGITEEKVIDGTTYCVTQIDEGAAGSVYSQYAYAFAYNDGTAILSFSTRAPRCENYSDPEKSLCEREKETFSLDQIIHMVAQTLRS